MLDSGTFKVRTEAEEAKPVYIGHEVDYLYDGQMPVMEQDFKNGVLQQTRVHLLGGRGIEAVVAIEHTSQGNPTTLSWLLYDGHGNLVHTMAPDYTLSDWQFRGVWGEVQGNLALGRGYCANLGHPEDETGLVYMRARYYEPATGRFISEDPARDGVNWYLYAEGNPVNKVDENGTEPILEWFNRVISPILERGGQYGLRKIVERILLPIRVLTGSALATAIFDFAVELEMLGISLIHRGSQNIATGAIWLRLAAAGGSLGQAMTAGYIGVRSIIGGAMQVAIGISILSAARVLAGISYGLE